MKFRKFRENVCARAAGGPRGGATVSAVAANTLFYSPMTLPTHLNHRFSGFEFPWPNHSSAVSPDIKLNVSPLLLSVATTWSTLAVEALRPFLTLLRPLLSDATI